MSIAIRTRLRPASINLEQHLKLAYLLVNKAEREAQLLTQQSRKDAALLAKKTKQKARRIGIKQGKKVATQEGETEIEKLRKHFSELITSLRRECLELTLAIAKEVISTELTTQPDSIASRIDAALSELGTAQAIELLLNPSDLERISNDSKTKLTQISLRVRSDSSISERDALLKTSSGQVELNWHAHLERIALSLKQHLTGQDSDRIPTTTKA